MNKVNVRSLRLALVLVLLRLQRGRQPLGVERPCLDQQLPDRSARGGRHGLRRWRDRNEGQDHSHHEHTR